MSRTQYRAVFAAAIIFFVLTIYTTQHVAAAAGCGLLLGYAIGTKHQNVAEEA